MGDLKKNLFKSLSHKSLPVSISNDTIKMLLIWQCNKINLPERKASALFATLSRINHSCSGCNAHWFWNNELSKQQLITLQNINKDSQVFVNYCEQILPSKERKAKLSKTWSFECQCKWCSCNQSKIDKMDKIIKEYQTMEASLESLLGKPMDGYKVSRKIVSIVEKHFNANADLMSKHCYDAAQFALGLQKWNEASFYLESSMKEKLIANGPDAQMSSDLIEKVAMLPPKFWTRFKKFDAKYRAKLKKKSELKTEDGDEKKDKSVKSKQNKNGHKGKKNQKSTNAKKAKKKVKNNQKKKKKTRK